MDLKPTILISSFNHLDEFREILDHTPTWKRVFGKYEILPNFPVSKGFLSFKTPLIYFSRGELNFQNDKMFYNAVDGQNRILPSYFNLKNLSFTLNRSDIKSLEMGSYKNIKGYPQKQLWDKWKWIKIICNENIFAGDFLICVDSVNNTKLLYEMLNQFKEGQTISTTLKDYTNSNMIKIGYIGMILLLTPLIMNSVSTIIYGTINENIGGPVTIISLLLGFTLFLIVSIWVYENRHNTKIQFYWLLFWFTYIFSYTINNLVLRT